MKRIDLVFIAMFIHLCQANSLRRYIAQAPRSKQRKAKRGRRLGPGPIDFKHKSDDLTTWLGIGIEETNAGIGFLASMISVRYRYIKSIAGH